MVLVASTMQRHFRVVRCRACRLRICRCIRCIAGAAELAARSEGALRVAEVVAHERTCRVHMHVLSLSLSRACTDSPVRVAESRMAHLDSCRSGISLKIHLHQRTMTRECRRAAVPAGSLRHTECAVRRRSDCSAA